MHEKTVITCHLTSALLLPQLHVVRLVSSYGQTCQ